MQEPKMDTTQIGTFAAWAAIMLGIVGLVAKALGRDLARHETDLLRLRETMQEEVRSTDMHVKEAILALDVRLQNELRLLIEASHLRLSALEARHLIQESHIHDILVKVARIDAGLEAAKHAEPSDRKT